MQKPANAFTQPRRDGFPVLKEIEMKNEWINLKKQKPTELGVYEVWDAGDQIALVSYWGGNFFGMCSRGMASRQQKLQEAVDGKDEPTEYKLTKWRRLPSPSASL